jgi:hypothetical protein
LLDQVGAGWSGNSNFNKSKEWHGLIKGIEKPYFAQSLS